MSVTVGAALKKIAVALLSDKKTLKKAAMGNREDLFPGSGYVDKYTKPPTTYDIPPSALEDETFAGRGYAQPCPGSSGAVYPCPV